MCLVPEIGILNLISRCESILKIRLLIFIMFVKKDLSIFWEYFAK